jgi:hypothetical protein
MVFTEGVRRWGKIGSGANSDFGLGWEVRQEREYMAVDRSFIREGILDGCQSFRIVQKSFDLQCRGSHAMLPQTSRW